MTKLIENQERRVVPAEESRSGPCHACGRHLEDTMETCPACEYNGNLGGWEGRASDEPTYLPEPTREALRKARGGR